METTAANNEQSILNKIIKLLKLAESNNAHEAAAAAARAAELMAKYELDAADLRLAQNRQNGAAPAEPIDEASVFVTKQRDGWRGRLMYGVAIGYGCRSFTRRSHIRDAQGKWEPQRDKKGNVIIVNGHTRWKTEVHWMVLGRPHGVNATKYTFAYLVNEIERLCKLAYRDLPDWERPLAAAATAWYTSFKAGASEEVSRRMIERRKSVQAAGKSTALVLVRKDEAEVEQAYNGMKLRTAAGYNISRGDAYVQGRRAGRNINLDGGKGLNAAPQQIKK